MSRRPQASALYKLQGVRQARESDLHAMAELKYQQLSMQLGSFLPNEVLVRMSPEHFLPQLQSMLEQSRFALEVHEENGKLDGFIIYAGRQQGEPCEQIVEVFTDNCELQQAMINRAADAMRQTGAKRIYVWIIRENFRLRYLYEMAGFRQEGVLGSKRLMEKDFSAVLYQRQ